MFKSIKSYSEIAAEQKQKLNESSIANVEDLKSKLVSALAEKLLENAEFIFESSMSPVLNTKVGSVSLSYSDGKFTINEASKSAAKLVREYGDDLVGLYIMEDGVKHRVIKVDTNASDNGLLIDVANRLDKDSIKRRTFMVKVSDFEKFFKKEIVDANDWKYKIQLVESLNESKSRSINNPYAFYSSYKEMEKELAQLNKISNPVKHISDRIKFLEDGIKNKVLDESLNEGEVDTEEKFVEYANTVLKKAFGDKFDQKKADETINGIIAKVKGDFSAAVGILQNSLGESLSLNEADVDTEEKFVEYATTVLKKAFGSDFDQTKADKTIKGIIGEVKGDFSAAVGILQNSLGK